jgi:predicted secreted protein
MASNAFAGVGTVFKRGIVAIAEVISISGPNISRAHIDVTNLDSTNGYREFIAGFRDAGEVTLSMNFTFATWQDFKDDIDDDNSVSYSVELPNTEGTIITFDGLVTSLGMAIPFDDKVTSDVTIKVDSVLVITS